MQHSPSSSTVPFPIAAAVLFSLATGCSDHDAGPSETTACTPTMAAAGPTPSSTPPADLPAPDDPPPPRPIEADLFDTIHVDLMRERVGPHPEGYLSNLWWSDRRHGREGRLEFTYVRTVGATLTLYDDGRLLGSVEVGDAHTPAAFAERSPRAQLLRPGGSLGDVRVHIDDTTKTPSPHTLERFIAAARLHRNVLAGDAIDGVEGANDLLACPGCADAYDELDWPLLLFGRAACEDWGSNRAAVEACWIGLESPADAICASSPAVVDETCR